MRKRNHPIIIVVLLLLGSLGFNSCSTDVDLAAPYDVKPVIVGVLDFMADTQFVRINKTYLGEGNNNLYAGIKDSVEYPLGSVDAWLVKVAGNQEIDSIQLLPIDLPSRDPGIFYNSDVRIYYTSEPILTEDEIDIVSSTNPNTMRPLYRLKVRVGGEAYTAEAEFPAVSQQTVSIPPLSSTTPSRRSYYVISNNGSYQPESFRYATNSTVGQYEAKVRINFDIEYTDGSILENQFIDFRLESRNNLDNTSFQERNASFNSSQWYEAVGLQFRAIENLSRVRIHDLEYILSAGNRELARYISVAQPVSQFVPVLSNYTNISGGAIGIFAAKTQIIRKAWLTEPSLQQLNIGSFTSGPSYCVINWSGSNFLCD